MKFFEGFAVGLFLIIITVIFSNIVAKIPEPPKQYYKLTMESPEGKRKVFLGISVTVTHGVVYYVTKDGVRHSYAGKYWREEITKKEYDEYREEQTSTGTAEAIIQERKN